MGGRHAKRTTWRRRGMAGTTVLAALAVTVWVVSFLRHDACAAAEADPAVSGRAMYYQGTDGHCSISGGELYASVSSGEYAGSRLCGGYLDVTGPRGTVRVQVVDSCPSCRSGEVDLSRAAFARIADPGAGVTEVVYRTVRNPELTRGLAFRVHKGSTAGWLALQVIDHGNPLSGVELLRDDEWHALDRGSDGYWVAPRGAGDGPFQLRVSDVHGQRATVKGVGLAPGRVQRTAVRLYEGAKAVEPVTASPPAPTPLPLSAEGVRRRC
ncbi:expansin EXLX1 family cellulose-binding protein [Nonomuraea dietziae]|uniref:expansin EXLX1 family cellulose-binding protein n=1 Tax=Nonomuraea dietziae TaxID=65515 RepID=UPI00343789F0